MSGPTKLEDTVIVPAVWVPLMLAGLLGNAVVIFVMIRHGDKNATNYYVINLALTDLAFASTVIPLTMMYYLLPNLEVLGRFGCKFHMYMIYVLLFATCLTMAAMTVDRYFSIVYPIESLPHRTPRLAFIVSALSWIVSLILCIPFAVYHDLVPDNITITQPVSNSRNTKTHHESLDEPAGPDMSTDKRQNRFDPDGDSVSAVNHVGCWETWPSIAAGQVAIAYVIILTYITPLTLIIGCYAKILRHLAKSPRAKRQVTLSTGAASMLPTNEGTHRHLLAFSRRRRKTIRMIAAIVFVFAVCWLPIHVLQLWRKFDDHFPMTTATYVYKIIAHSVSYAIPTINPIVYCFLGDGFRKAASRAWPGFRRAMRRLMQSTVQRSRAVTTFENRILPVRVTGGEPDGTDITEVEQTLSSEGRNRSSAVMEGVDAAGDLDRGDDAGGHLIELDESIGEGTFVIVVQAEVINEGRCDADGED